MNLSQLEVFVAIVETGSLTEAAEFVGLTQSAVSHSLSKLEAELGVTLLERSRQGIALTTIGAEVLPHARNLLAQVEVIRQKTARERGLWVGKLRFGCVPTIPPRLLTGILRDFQHQYPDIEVVLFEGAPAELMGWLDTGLIDIATVIDPKPFTESVELVHSEIKVIVSSTHDLALQETVVISQLKDEPMVGPKAEYGILQTLEPFKYFSRQRAQYEVSTPTTIFTMVRENMGFAILPKILLDTNMDGITARSIEPPLFLSIYLATRTPSPATQTFMAMAQRWAQEHGFSQV